MLTMPDITYPKYSHPSPTTALELLSPASESQWNDYVAAHPDATIFHELSYRRAVVSAYGHRPIYLVARRDGQLCGVLPMFLIDSRLAGRMLVSMPYAIYGGPLADDAEAENCLRCGTERAAAARDAAVIDWRKVTATRESSARWNANPHYVTFRRTLPTDPEKVLGWLPRKARAAARRAGERNDLTVAWNDADWPLVWQLYARSMRRLGSINYTQRFFETLLAETPGQHLVQTVSSAGRPVAGLLTFLYRDVAMPYFVGFDERADIYGLSNYLYFALMQKAVTLGCRTFDFGRSRMDNTGSCDFKASHGFEPTPLAYERFVAAGTRDPQLTPSNPRFSFARRMWPHLPLRVTQSLGGWLSRSIPG